ncbi:holin [Bacillus phage 000TH010]|uniref:Holin n=1 Tax=Bacillus phage 000TH010 TaxID=2601652 RepID=A0A5P8PHQ1_9CAUD|nr:holin [Bacillus phage 000TH010]QFR56247.1 holin [Bacillus phage 000TH010]
MKMDTGTKVRTILFLIAWVNQLLSFYNLEPIPVDEATAQKVYDAVSVLFTIAVTVWTSFKNNYLTLKGKQQRETLKKNGLTK